MIYICWDNTWYMWDTLVQVDIHSIISWCKFKSITSSDDAFIWKLVWEPTQMCYHKKCSFWNNKKEWRILALSENKGLWEISHMKCLFLFWSLFKFQDYSCLKLLWSCLKTFFEISLNISGLLLFKTFYKSCEQLIWGQLQWIS